MGIAEAIASRVGDKYGGEEEKTPAETEAKMKPGDHGRRILSAIEAKDPIAIEHAIQDCVEDSDSYGDEEV